MRKEEAGEIRGKVVEIAALVRYQEGAVVSRTLIDKKVGTMTVFAFDRGQGLSEHTTPYDAVIIDLEGEVEVTLGGESIHLGTGQMLIMPAKVPHALKAITRFKMMLIMIRE